MTTEEKSTNIILSGVGGQGLVLSTKLIADACMLAGYHVKTNDVIGLSQRGGKVWGTVKFGAHVNSPNIATGQGNYMIAMEPLEALRWLDTMKEGSHVFMNERPIYPTPVLMEQEAYPGDIGEKLGDKCNLTSIDAFQTGKDFGTEKLANTILIGMLAFKTSISYDTWLTSLQNNVPDKFITQNEQAFEFGYNYQGDG